MRAMPFMKRKKGVQFAGVGIDSGGGGVNLPIATRVRLGGVKIGNGVNVTEDGVISVSGGLVDFTSDEQPLGIKWLDGKELYVRTFSGTKTDASFYFDVANIDFVYPICAYLEQSGGTLIYPFFRDSNRYFTVMGQSQSTKRRIVLESAYTGIPYHVTLIYTKK